MHLNIAWTSFHMSSKREKFLCLWANSILVVPSPGQHAFEHHLGLPPGLWHLLLHQQERQGTHQGGSNYFRWENIFTVAETYLNLLVVLGVLPKMGGEEICLHYSFEISVSWTINQITLFLNILNLQCCYSLVFLKWFQKKILKLLWCTCNSSLKLSSDASIWTIRGRAKAT